MMKLGLPWRNNKMSFKLMPLSPECNFLEARFNFDEKALNVMSKVKYQIYNMFPKLDDNGEVSYKPGKPAPGAKPVLKQERKQSDAFYDYVITEKDDIQKFVDLMTGTTNDLEQYFIVEPPQAQAVTAEHMKKLEVVKDGK